MRSLKIFLICYIPLSIIMPVMMMGCINDVAVGGNSPMCGGVAYAIVGSLGISPLAAIISVVIVLLRQQKKV